MMRVSYKKGLIISDEMPKYMIELFSEFLTYTNNILSANEEFGSFVEAFIDNRMPKSINDFDDETIRVDARLFLPDFRDRKGKSLRTNTKMYLKYFYIFLIKNKYGHFKVIDENILSFHNIFSRLAEDYLISYAPSAEEIKNNNKFLIINNGRFYSFDFTKINHKPYSELLKGFILKNDTIKLKTKATNMHYYVDLLNFLPSEDIPIHFTNELAVSYKQKVTSVAKTTQSAFIHISSIKGIIDYFCATGNCIMQSHARNLLAMRNVNSKGKTAYYSKEEIGKILSLLEEKSSNGIMEGIREYYRLSEIILLYILNTSMRIETIISLKINDLEESVHNSFYYRAHSKTNDNEKYNITRKIKSLHDEVLEITKKYRNPNLDVNDYLFIHKKFRRSNLITAFSRNNISKVLKESCTELGIQYLGIEGVRNRFMNRVTIQLNNGGDKNLLENITRHSRQVHFQNYYKNNTEQIVMQLYGVSIGDKPLNGFVKDTIDDNIKSNIVMNGRGSCSMNDCENKTNLDCLMCRNFVCSPENIPYFESEIKNLDRKIIETTIPHEKEFLVAKKALNVKYLVECKKVKERRNKQ